MAPDILRRGKEDAFSERGKKMSLASSASCGKQRKMREKEGVGPAGTKGGRSKIKKTCWKRKSAEEGERRRRSR